MNMLKTAMAYIWARLKEPSTYAGIAGIVSGISMAMAGNVPGGITTLGAGVIAIVAPEKAQSAVQPYA